jgi:hypothetical protein
MSFGVMNFSVAILPLISLTKNALLLLFAVNVLSEILYVMDVLSHPQPNPI